MSDNEEIYTPPPQDILTLFAAVDLSSCSSSDSAEYKRAWLKTKVIRSSIFYARECTDKQSRALYIAMNHKEIAQYANAITQHEQKKKKNSLNICQ